MDRGFDDSLSAWRGFEGYKHDFLFNDKAIEIKGTFGSTHSHTINGIDQLRTPESMPLYLISFLCVKNGNNSENLKVLVKSIESSLNGEPQQYEDFQKLLKAAKYNKLHEGKYENLGITLIENNCYEVTDEFPRLTSLYLNRPLSERVSGISYKINLEDMQYIKLEDL